MTLTNRHQSQLPAPPDAGRYALRQIFSRSHRDTERHEEEKCATGATQRSPSLCGSLHSGCLTLVPPSCSPRRESTPEFATTPRIG